MVLNAGKICQNGRSGKTINLNLMINAWLCPLAEKRNFFNLVKTCTAFVDNKLSLKRKSEFLWDDCLTCPKANFIQFFFFLFSHNFIRIYKLIQVGWASAVDWRNSMILFRFSKKLLSEYNSKCEWELVTDINEKKTR